MLNLAREDRLALDHDGDSCSVRRLDAGVEEAITVPLPRSVFRAVLARVAALCNERVPNSVTPYRGDGELAFPANPIESFRVSFTNTPDEQMLEMRPVERVAGVGAAEVNATPRVSGIEFPAVHRAG